MRFEELERLTDATFYEVKDLSEPITSENRVDYLKCLSREVEQFTIVNMGGDDYRHLHEVTKGYFPVIKIKFVEE